MFTNQDSDGARVIIEEVTVPEDGFVAIYDERLITGEGLVEDIRGVSSFLDTGSHEQVEVTLDGPITVTQRLWALAHRDTMKPGSSTSLLPWETKMTHTKVRRPW